MARTIQQLNEMIERHGEHAELYHYPVPNMKDEEVDRLAVARIEERNVALKDTPNLDDYTAERLVKQDAIDFAQIKSGERAYDALLTFDDNRAAKRYDLALQSSQELHAKAVAAGQREARLVAAKDERKNAEYARATGEGPAAPARAATAGAAAATAAAESMREEDRARLEAFASLKRQEALVKHPELQRAYDLQDASNAFRHQHIADKSASDAFAKMTDDYIRQKLIHNEPLPELRRIDQEKEIDAKTRDVESARPKEVELER